jgi:hypothetical protein
VNVALAAAAALAVAQAVRMLAATLSAWRAPAVVAAPRAADRAGDLERLERAVATATTHAGDVHVRLRPILREIAGEGVRRHGVDLDADPVAAQALLAPVTWDLVRADRPRPGDAFARGLAPKELDAVLDDLEGLLS